jgi:hypothetical protein
MGTPGGCESEKQTAMGGCWRCREALRVAAIAVKSDLENAVGMGFLG